MNNLKSCYASLAGLLPLAHEPLNGNSARALGPGLKRHRLRRPQSTQEGKRAPSEVSTPERGSAGHADPAARRHFFFFFGFGRKESRPAIGFLLSPCGLLPKLPNGRLPPSFKLSESLKAVRSLIPSRGTRWSCSPVRSGNA